MIYNDELLTTTELAKRTSLTRRFWENRRITGETPPYIQIGDRAVRYKWSDVQSWLDKQTKSSTSANLNSHIAK